MMITKFSYILFFLSAGFVYTNAAWKGAAQKAYQRMESDNYGANTPFKFQCVVKCVKADGPKPKHEKLADDTACLKLGFRKVRGTCKDGVCQS
ncbi:unnamed protein product [Cunninghamella blakesleeana]